MSRIVKVSEFLETRCMWPGVFKAAEPGQLCGPMLCDLDNRPKQVQWIKFKGLNGSEVMAGPSLYFGAKLERCSNVRGTSTHKLADVVRIL